jgi:hypothetical protein
VGEIESEMRRIAAMSRTELVSEWPTYFKVPPPHKASIEFLRMAIAWHRQARECPATIGRLERRLSRMAASMAAGKRPRALGAAIHVQQGATLVRTWRGKDYVVTVIDKRFVFEGTSYASLSEVARRITGTRWNGPSFFGLRVQKAKPASGGANHG